MANDVYEMRIRFARDRRRGQVCLHFESDLVGDPDPFFTAGILWFAYVQNMWADVREAQGAFVFHDRARVQRLNNGKGPWWQINPVLVPNPFNPRPMWFETAAVITMSGKLAGRWQTIPYRFPGVWADGQGTNEVPDLQRTRLLFAASRLFLPWVLLGRTYRCVLWSRRHQVAAFPEAVNVKLHNTNCPRRRLKGW